MSVTVDHERLQVDQLGLRTVGQVLSHLQRDNRLVVNLLIDGQEPDLDCLGQVKQSPLNGHTLFIETAEPRDMALEVVDEIENQFAEADRLRGKPSSCSSATARLRRWKSSAAASARGTTPTTR